MADWPELKAILLPFPCLWDPQDPYFLDKTVKAVCREQVLEIYNQRSSVPIDTKSLNQWIADNLKQFTPTLQTATEERPTTTLPQGPSKVAECVPQEKTPTEILPITTSCQSERNEVGGNTAGGRTATEELPITTLPQGPSNIAECMPPETTPTEILPITTSCQSERIEVSGNKAGGRITLENLIKEFPCLWNRKDLNYNDNVMRKRCMELLLQKFNRLSSTEITMVDLKRKLHTLFKRRSRLAIRKTFSSATSLLNHGNRNQKTVAPGGMPKLQDLLKEFPCLWDCKDLNYNDNVMRKRCMELLLQKFNRLSSTEITMVDLRRKLRTLFKRRSRLEAKKVQGVSEGQLETAGGEEVLEITADNFRALFDNTETDPQASIDSTDSSQISQDGHNQETLVLQGRCVEAFFNYCRFCGELKNCRSDTTDINPYVANNKCTLIINDLRAELEFTDDILPRNICRDCERKFQEMVDFVKCVKDAQVKLNRFNNETLDRRQNEDSPTNNAESGKEADGQRKSCKVTVAMNSDELQSLSDNNVENNDIEINNYDETGAFLLIVAESEQRDGSGVPINESAPSLSLNNGNTNSISHCHPAETATTYITTWADFLKNKPLNEKIYVKATPLSQKPHQKSTQNFEDVNTIDIKQEFEIADEYINDKQKQPND